MDQKTHSHALTVRTFSSSDMAAVITLYQTCFAEPPWFETFNPEELALEFTDILSWDDAVFLISEVRGETIGGAVGFDLRRKVDVMALLPQRVTPRFYLSELFVAPAMRNQHVAQALLQKRFAMARERGYTEAVVRTSINQPIIRSIYERLGFKIVATQQVESTKLVNGVHSSTSDHRIILTGRIP